VLEKEKVDVLIAGETSASREAIRPIVYKDDAFYFYTNQYEGVHVIAADYDFCHSGPDTTSAAFAVAVAP
jgi:hypothetical protein